MIPVPVFALPPLVDIERDDEREHTIYVETSSPDRVQVELIHPEIPFVNAAQFQSEEAPDWDAYVGQEPLKRQLRVFIDDAKSRCEPLPHILLASGMPGVGKTTMARLIAKEMGAELTMLVPPFSARTLYDAAMQVGDWDILFIDEIHKLGDHGPAAAENLLHLLDERVLYLDDGVHVLADMTVIGATTDADKLPETVIDRFPVNHLTGAYFQKYTPRELLLITKGFCDMFETRLRPDVMVAIAKACRGTPRIARTFVRQARALQASLGRECSPSEILRFAQTEPDGTTRQHIAYLTSLFQFFGREKPVYGTDRTEWEYVAGEASLMNILRENKPGLARLERFLIESGLVDRTPRGRRLTDRGVAKARYYVQRGLGLATG